MGANYFRTEAQGKTVHQAYNVAQEEAYYEHGHNGYTGSIAEKDGYKIFKLPEDFSDPDDYCDFLNQLDGDELGETIENHVVTDYDLAVLEIYNDKWADAVAFDMGDDWWFFCGTASS